jgi:hypothetical protein
MARTSKEQKRIESWFLEKARDAGVPIPLGEIPGEEPDFRFQTSGRMLGVELSEVLRSAWSNHGILPVQEESVHQEIIECALRCYYATPNAKPVHLHVRFTNTRGKRHNKQLLASTLAQFVHANIRETFPAANFAAHQAPQGFDWVHLDTQLCPNAWSIGEAGGITISDIRPVVEARIAAKDKFAETYRANLPKGAPVWLLLYTSVTVARSMPIPFGAEEWRIPSQFDKVFWFTALENQFVEIRGK